MNKPVIVINGSGGVGKDEFVKFCTELVSVKNVSTVDKVKIAGRFLDVDPNGEKTEELRKFWSDLKMLVVAYNDHPYKYVKREIESFQKDSTYHIMFIHSREPAEIQRFVDLGCMTLLVINHNVAPITSNMADANVMNFKYNYYIDNSGTLVDLRTKAHKFVEKVLK